MFKIGDFSHICRVPVSALRYYADLGLLEPAHIDRFTGYRYYSFDQLPRLNRILALKDLGLSLEQIARLLDEDVSGAEIRGMLRLKRAEIQQHVVDELARLARVEARLRQIEQEGKMPDQEVVLKKIEPQKVIAIREVLPTPQHVGTLIGQIYTAMAVQRIVPVGPPFSIYHDPDFKPENLDVEVAFPVAQPATVALEGGRQVSTRDISAIQTAACIVHKGPYDTLDQTYSAIGKWIEANGYRVVGAPHEVYLTAPDSESGPITEIQFPVEKARPTA